MKPAFLLLLVASTLPAADPELAAQWLRTDWSEAERDAMVERGRKARFAEIGPVLLEVLVKHRPTFGHHNHSGDKPWNSDLLKGGARNYVMAEVVWTHHMRQPNDPQRARVLLRLFETSRHSLKQFWLVSGMTRGHWIPEMEPVLASKLDDDSVDQRHAILRALLHRADLDTYLPRVISFVREEKDWFERLRIYNRLTNLGNRFYALKPFNQQALIDLGFELLEAVPAGKLDQAYQVARRLGFFVRAENTFAPDQTDPKYRGEGRLKDSFFGDTVRNALAWRREMNKPR